jgi:hypothetical protein
MMTTASMASPSKKNPFDDDDGQQDPSCTPSSPLKRQKVGDDSYDGDVDGDADSNGNDELEPKSGDDELFPLDSEDRKLFKWHARSDDGDNSSESVDSVSYRTIDNSDDDDGGNNNDDNNDDATGEFSDEEDW